MTIGNIMKVKDKTDALVTAIFGGDDAVIEDTFQIFEDRKENTGKLYLPLHVCLEAVKTMPFDVKGDVREDKVVLHY